MQQRTIGLFLVLSLLLAACTVTRQDSIEDMVAEGISPENAECVITLVEQQGFEPGDLVGIVSDDAVEAMKEAMLKCLDGSAFTPFADEDDLQAIFRDTLTESGLTSTQADCAVDSLRASGYTMTDVVVAEIDDLQDSGAADAIGDAVSNCLTPTD